MIFRLSTVLMLLLLSGCVTYRGGAVPEVDPSMIAVPRMQRVIAYDLRVDSNVGGDFDAARVAGRELNSALRSAGAELEASGSVADPDAELAVELKARGNRGAQFISGFISGFTFTLIPAYASVELVTEAELRESGEIRKRYRYADSLSLWVQLFLLPFTNSSDRVRDELIADMMRSLARDMQRDGFLPTPGGEELSRSSPP